MNTMILLLFTLVAATSAQYSTFPDKLFCNRLTGNYVVCCEGINLISFGRPLEPGDKITINGTVGPKAGFWYLRINIRDSSQSIRSFHMRTKTLSTDWPRPDDSQILFNANLGNGWGADEYAPNPFTYGAPYQITIQYTGSGFIFSSGNMIVKNFALRNSPAVQLMYLELSADFSTNWVQMDCVRPLATTASPRAKVTRRIRKPENGNENEYERGSGKGFSSGSDYGSGYGSDYGSGYGSGPKNIKGHKNGRGFGKGSKTGSDSGSGYDTGYGSGYGSRPENVNGYKHGRGSDRGSKSGSGYGIGRGSRPVQVGGKRGSSSSSSSEEFVLD